MYVSLEECIMSCSRQRQRIMDSRRRLSIASTRYVFENIAPCCCFFSQRQPEKKSNKHFLIVDVFLFSNVFFVIIFFFFLFSSIVSFFFFYYLQQSKNMDVRNGPSLDVFYQAESASNVVKGGTII